MLVRSKVRDIIVVDTALRFQSRAFGYFKSLIAMWQFNHGHPRPCIPPEHYAECTLIQGDHHADQPLSWSQYHGATGFILDFCWSLTIVKCIASCTSSISRSPSSGSGLNLKSGSGAVASIHRNTKSSVNTR